MSFLVVLFFSGLVIGMASVASNPSPFFAALGLVLVAGMGCGVLALCGGTFLSLVLFLIYLGGMLVVFAYSAALAAEPYPEAWTSWPVFIALMVYLVGVGAVGLLYVEGVGEGYLGLNEGVLGFDISENDTAGVAMLYSLGGGLLMVAGWGLLLSLFVVLELSRGFNRGALRSV
uniref:NADH dehydrogenase subunit 6 n=1 Tax=Omobranchus fasciolatoceps TaxID=57835 RepID=UPI001EDFD0C2|nr:NADH dehydrogenase subunit 6 [Omobranchus fasciolatoceps]UHY39624.1 NADH dehydrogenase subunit 6 [Omobranchus fasciolatoceps]URH13680.1 NADH dehydrogenase subunit 6 [Omobranchus fasciolatoceps]